MRIVADIESARSTLLRRIPWGLGEVPPSVRERIRSIFGEELSPDEAVARIIAEVRAGGDAALVDLTRRIDRAELDRLAVSQGELAAARQAVEPGLARALELAAERVRSFHEKCLRRPWVDREQELGELVRPLNRVGVYAPGGTAAYPSTVLMTVIPARVAGVEEVALATPPRRDGSVSPPTLLAAAIAGVDQVFKVGGAQAIAALAYGTESIPRADKVCGPGNLFVMLAKRQVYGVVDIDGLYGPTETVVLADDSANPALCAADLIAQAEHDEMASAIMITTSRELAEEVSQEVKRQLVGLERRDIARAAIERRGGIVVVGSIDEGIELVNDYAPEHLCLMVREPWSYLDRIANAGGIFLGESSPEALGDYIAGPSHVMPTGGTARFASPLGVGHFLKTTSLIALSHQTARELGEAAATIASAEGLTGHARAVEARLSMSPPNASQQSQGGGGCG